MIHAVLVVNEAGQARLVRWYTSVTDQTNLLRRIFLAVSRRGDSQCNFLDFNTLAFTKKTKLVYRHYATLYFIFVCEETESELGILDLIQVFVEALDRCFESVCELDLIFHADRVHYVLDEMVQGGLVLETNMTAVLKAVDDMSRAERLTAPATTPSAAASGALQAGQAAAVSLAGTLASQAPGAASTVLQAGHAAAASLAGTLADKANTWLKR